MNPILRKAIEDGLALFPVNIPEQVALLLASALTHTIEELVRKHTSDPEFGTKIEAWHIQAQAAKGGTDDEKANAASVLYALLGS